jgi:hypothetical protein
MSSVVTIITRNLDFILTIDRAISRVLSLCSTEISASGRDKRIVSKTAEHWDHHQTLSHNRCRRSISADSRLVKKRRGRVFSQALGCERGPIRHCYSTGSAGTSGGARA